MNKFQMPAIEVLMFDEEEVVMESGGEPIGFSIGNDYVKAGQVEFKTEMVKVNN